MLKFRLMILSLVLLAVCAGTVRAETGFDTYRLKAGDTVVSVAKQFNMEPKALMRINRLDDARGLVVGSLLIVAVPTTAASGNPVPVRANSAPAPKPAPVVSAPKVAFASVAEAQPAPVAAAKAPQAAPAKSSFLTDYEEPQQERSQMSAGKLIFDLIWKLILVLGIAYASIYALRLIMGKQAPLPGKKGNLRVIESASLGPNRSLHLVRIGDEVVVLGSTQEQITTISRLDNPELNAQLSQEGPRPFTAHLDTAMTADPKVELAQQVQGGIRHLWDHVQEIRGLRSAKGVRQ